MVGLLCNRRTRQGRRQALCAESDWQEQSRRFCFHHCRVKEQRTCMIFQSRRKARRLRQVSRNRRLCMGRLHQWTDATFRPVLFVQGNRQAIEPRYWAQSRLQSAQDRNFVQRLKPNDWSNEHDPHGFTNGIVYGGARDVPAALRRERRRSNRQMDDQTVPRDRCDLVSAAIRAGLSRALDAMHARVSAGREATALESGPCSRVYGSRVASFALDRLERRCGEPRATCPQFGERARGQSH